MALGDGSAPPRTQPPWIGLTTADSRPPADEPRGKRRTWIQVTASAVAVIVGVAFFGVIAARNFAEDEAILDAAKTADIVAEAVVQPVLRDDILTGAPDAVTALDKVAAQLMVAQAVVRVKIWDEQGRIVYSDQPALIGQVFTLESDRLDVLVHPQTRSAVSDLQEPENIYERGNGKLLEVYRGVRTAGGHHLLLEIYFRYSNVLARMGELWRAFAGLTLGSIALLVVLLSPVVWRLLRRLKKFQIQREGLLQHAVDASTEERRRIAGTLHDGVVQDLVATSLAVSGSAHRAAAAGQAGLAADLRATAGTVRASIAALRSLLVGIYPLNLARAGLVSALEDLAVGLRSRGTRVEIDLADAVPLNPADERLIFRIAQECFTNAARHAKATRLDVTLTADDGDVVLDIRDDGTGFDPAAVFAHRPTGHFGVHILGDVAGAAGAELQLATAPGAGTHWRLRIPGSRETSGERRRRQRADNGRGQRSSTRPDRANGFPSIKTGRHRSSAERGA